MKPDLRYFHSQAEMIRWFQVNPKTIKKYVEADWFPKPNAKGKWPREKVLAAVADFNTRLEEQTTGQELKDEKTRLECEHIRIRIKTEMEKYKQERIRTAEKEGDVWLRSEVLASWDEYQLRAKRCVESFRQAQSAKHRNIKTKRLLDGLCDGILAELCAEFTVKKGG